MSRRMSRSQARRFVEENGEEHESTQEPRPRRNVPKFKPYPGSQTRYVEYLSSKICTIGHGCAGTGKTFLAVSVACDLLKDKTIETITITRPAVEAEEKLGFLPGTRDEKFDPYFAPVKGYLVERLGGSYVDSLIKNNRIIISPLAFMRGHTFKNTFVILDEAQNTTIRQMKMFLTRIGENSRVAINGDTTQCDLPSNQKSGLQDAIDRLGTHPQVGHVYFGEDDIVRHGFVREVIRAYENKTLTDDEFTSNQKFRCNRNGIMEPC